MHLTVPYVPPVERGNPVLRGTVTMPLMVDGDALGGIVVCVGVSPFADKPVSASDLELVAAEVASRCRDGQF